MNLFPDEMSLIGGGGNALRMVDDTGLSITTSKRLSITGASVTLSAPKINLSAPMEMVLSSGAGSGITLCRDIHMKPAARTLLEGTVHETFPAIQDAPQVFDWGKLALNVVAGLAVVGIVAVIALTGGLAAPLVIAGAAAFGATMVAIKAYNDCKDGTVSGIGSYMWTGLVSTGSALVVSTMAPGVFSYVGGRAIGLQSASFLRRAVLNPTTQNYLTGMATSILTDILDNYSGKSMTQIVFDGAVSGAVNVGVEKAATVFVKYYARSLAVTAERKHLLQLSNKFISKEAHGKTMHISRNPNVEMEVSEIGRLYTGPSTYKNSNNTTVIRPGQPIRNQNELARAIKEDPSEVAKKSVEGTIQQSSIQDLPEYPTAKVCGDILKNIPSSIITYELNRADLYRRLGELLDSFKTMNDEKEDDNEPTQTQPGV